MPLFVLFQKDKVRPRDRLISGAIKVIKAMLSLVLLFKLADSSGKADVNTANESQRSWKTHGRVRVTPGVQATVTACSVESPIGGTLTLNCRRITSAVLVR